MKNFLTITIENDTTAILANASISIATITPPPQNAPNGIDHYSGCHPKHITEQN